MAAIGARIGEAFIALVEGLRGVERALRRKAKGAVRFALELGKIVKKAGRDLGSLSLNLLDARLTPADALEDGFGERAIIRKTRERSVRMGELFRCLKPRGEPALGRFKIDAELEIIFGDEGADGLLALDKESERR